MASIVMIKGVFFDFDGVIVDSETVHNKFILDFFAENNINIPKEETYRIVGGNPKMNVWEDIYQRYRSEFKDDYETFRKKLRQNNRAKMASFDYSTVLFEDVKPTLSYLRERNYKLALCSSSPLEYLKKNLNSCKIEDYFDILLSGEMFEQSKPNPEIYLKCLKMSGLSLNEVLVIEDSKYGIESAKNAGLKVLAIRDKKFGIDQSEAFAIIDSFSDLIDYLK